MKLNSIRFRKREKYRSFGKITEYIIFFSPSLFSEAYHRGDILSSFTFPLIFKVILHHRLLAHYKIYNIWQSLNPFLETLVSKSNECKFCKENLWHQSPRTKEHHSLINQILLCHYANSSSFSFAHERCFVFQKHLVMRKIYFLPIENRLNKYTFHTFH